ncbi:endonuclease/exonuclease/phosphatase family protein [Cytobacillus suaedae]|nr:endonuclease/exonuclease/phosphatase family protein [Cytobacillus suaedae]
MELNVLTFNIHHGKGLDKRVNLERIANIIKRSKADIIGLNEVDVSFGKRSQFLNQAAILAELLEMDYVFGPVISRKKRDRTVGEYGNVILSRFNVISDKNHLLFSHPYLAEPRGLLEVNLEVFGKVVSAFVTHLSINPLLQRKQIKDIEKIIQKKSNVIIMGDFNMNPKSRNHSYLTKILKDTSESECGNTYPANKPRKKLDYIFINDEIALVESKVVTIDPVASDHLPLMSKISIDD